VPVVWQWRRNRGHRGRPPAIGPQVVDRRDPLSDEAFVAGLRPIPVRPLDATSARPASDITGVSPRGQALEVRFRDFDQPALVIFLHTHCDGCDEYWRGFGGFGGASCPPSVLPIIVTLGPDSVAPADVESAAAGVIGVPVVMSDQAWSDYRVSGYPFFVLVDTDSRRVIGETVGFGWDDVVAMVRSCCY